MKRIVWLKSAKLDLLDIHSYYTENASPQVASRLLKRIHTSTSQLIDQPLMGVTRLDDDILEWNIPDLSYTVPYQINGDDIEVLRVFHTAQKKPSRWENE